MGMLQNYGTCLEQDLEKALTSVNTVPCFGFLRLAVQSFCHPSQSLGNVANLVLEREAAYLGLTVGC